jgi:hypothetical protein
VLGDKEHVNGREATILCVFSLYTSERSCLMCDCIMKGRSCPSCHDELFRRLRKTLKCDRPQVPEPSQHLRVIPGYSALYLGYRWLQFVLTCHSCLTCPLPFVSLFTCDT